MVSSLLSRPHSALDQSDLHPQAINGRADVGELVLQLEDRLQRIDAPATAALIDWRQVNLNPWQGEPDVGLGVPGQSMREDAVGLVRAWSDATDVLTQVRRRIQTLLASQALPGTCSQCRSATPQG